MSDYRIVLAGVVLTLLSFFTIPLLDVDYLPSDGDQFLLINFSFSDASPRVVEKEVTQLIENRVSQIQGISKIKSVSSYGQGYIELKLDRYVDASWMETYLGATLRTLHDQLPEGCTIPNISRQTHEDADKQALLIFELIYSVDDRVANKWFQSQLRPQLTAVPEIARVTSFGSRQYAWELVYDTEKLRQAGVSKNKISEIITKAFGRQSLGTMKDAARDVPVFVVNDISSLSDLRTLDITPSLQLKDLVSFAEIPERVNSYQRINGKNAIFINCYAQDGLNKIEAARTIRNEVAKISQSMPDGFELSVNYDDTEYLSRELSKTWTRAILSILVISLLIILSSRSWRYLLSLLANALVSLGLTLLHLWTFDIVIHLYTIAGITISIGIMVDNAIILIDQLRKDSNKLRVVRMIMPAQLAAALTTISALLVILLLPAEYREELTGFGWVISIALFSSLLVSWWFTPSLHRMLNAQKQSDRHRSTHYFQELLFTYYQKVIRALLKYRRAFIVLVILSFGFPVFLLPTRWGSHPIYNKTIGSDVYQEHWRPIVNKALGGSLRMFYQDVYEKSAYRTPEQTQLYLTARLPYGHTLDQMNDIIRQAENYLSATSGLEQYITRVYSGRYASIVIQFDENTNDAFPYQLKNRLIQRSLDWGGVTWSVYGVGKGFSNATGASLPGFRVTMKGYNYEKLEIHATTLANKLLRHKRIQKVNTNSSLSWREEPLVQYRMKPLAPYLRPVHLYDTYHHLQQKQTSLVPDLKLNVAGNPKSIYLSPLPSEKLTIYSSLQPGNKLFPLLIGSQLTQELTVSSIHREDRQYIRSVAFDYYGSHRFGKKYLDQTLTELSSELPPGYSAEAKTWSWSSDKEKRRYELLLVLILIVFLVSTVFLESFKLAFSISFMIPLSYIGIFLIFSLGDFSFDQGGYAAFLMVGGLSVNAMYYLSIQYHRNLQIYDSFSAMVFAIREKSWPITMTVISTCAGLVPFIIHGESEVFWFSFAIGTIGGMLFSLMVAFIVLPVLLIDQVISETVPINCKSSMKVDKKAV